MVKPRIRAFLRAATVASRRWVFLLPLAVMLATLEARAVPQFDVFVGYDGVVPEGSWFPMVFEVKNDGPSFTGVIEISAGQFNESQTRRVVVELPTGTLKRLVIPVFSTARYQSSWDARLLDERGHMRAEQPGLRPKRQAAASTTVLGALPRTATGVPVFRATKKSESELQPATARLTQSILPDNPLVFEGMDCIYLSSEKAADLNVQQVSALLDWLNLGGHLIVGVEQITDVNATPWLRKLVPCDLTDIRATTDHHELQDWLRSPSPIIKARTGNPNENFNPYSDVAVDPVFEKAELQVATGALKNATVLAASGGTPLIVESRQNRGRVTTILFSPERKPFSTWNNLPSFWSKLAGVSPELYLNDNNNNLRGGWSIDGVFGAMIDSKQVRKLPVEWLLLLLIIYLVVIGPLDQYWLKRIKRPMLTWITFPCYVVLFSLLIYFIGYKLRAGETEWNELHLVDVLSHGEGAELRGRSYASIYSPVNARYGVATQQRFSTFRGEFQSSWAGGGQDVERANVVQTGDNFTAEVDVPVWTSQLFVSDWWQSAEMPLRLTVAPTAADGGSWSVTVENRRDRVLSGARIVIRERIVELGDLPAHGTKTFNVTKGQGMPLRDFVTSHASIFQSAAQSRQRAFGSTGGGQIQDVPNSCVAISFISNMSQERFISPPGLDLSSLADEGDAILLAWEPDYSPIKPLNQFTSRRGRKDTLWRVSTPLNAAP